MKGLYVLLAAFLTGCGTQSLHALHTPDVTVMDNSLIGTWATEDGKNRAVVEAGEGKTYSIAYTNTDDGEPVEMHITGRLVELDALRFADLELAKPSRDEMGRRFGMFALPVHLLVRVEAAKDSLELWIIDPDWLAGQVEAGDAPARQRVGDQFVFSADARALQEFLRRHGANRSAYVDDVIRMRRQRPAP